ncbi:MAG: hypothetical protein ABTQ73_08555 [Caldilineales bacterium]
MVTFPQAPFLWSRAAADDLARGLLTPLTWSILSQSAERALRSHYAAWGVALPHDLPIWRRIAGRAYLNTGALTTADQAVAADEVDAGSGWRLFGRAPDRRQKEVLQRQLQQAVPVFAATRSWQQGVATMSWRQATLLQVMEEIEPRSEAVLTVRDYLMTGLGSARRQLTRRLAEWLPQSHHELFDALFAGVDGREGWAQYRFDMQMLVQAARQNTAVAAYLAAGDWSAPLPDAGFRQRFEDFVAAYACWADQPLEAASPRWAEAPATLLQRLAARLQEPAEAMLISPVAAAQQRAETAARISAELGSKRGRQFMAEFESLQQSVQLLPPSREALVMVMAAARLWALGAAQEAVQDGRLTAPDEVFLLQLEELKQMMTGELHDAAQVQALVVERRAQQAAWQRREPDEVILE